MSDLSKTTVAELAVELPQASRLFEKHGIDYCCGGRRTVADACATAGVDLNELLREIEKGGELPPSLEYKGLSQRALIEYIVGTHHVFTREELSRLDTLLRKVCSVHEARHPELAALRAAFGRLADELIPHMMKEENVLFPYVASLERGLEQNAPPSPPPFMTVRNPVRMMMLEHENAGALLQEIRRLTLDYTPPPEGCVSYQTLYAALANLESDLHQHIHLENNILFPRALWQEQQLTQKTEP